MIWVKRIDIFISSPSDVHTERDAVERAVENLNRSGFGRQYFLFPLRYEKDAAPEAGRSPQVTVDRYLSVTNSYIMVAMLWTRIGTPMVDEFGREHPSGTVYEIDQAFKSNQENEVPHILLYQKVDEDPDADQKQLQMVNEFFASFEGKRSLRQGLYQKYSVVDEFERLVERHLRRILEKYPPPENAVELIEKPVYKTEPRRLDVAIPSEVPDDSETELRAMICLPDSEGLKALLPDHEDETRIGQDDVRKGTLSIAFIKDKDTGELQSATLTVEVDAPDFDPPSQSKSIDLAYSYDSALMAFRLKPLSPKRDCLIIVTVKATAFHGGEVVCGTASLYTEITSVTGRVACRLWKMASRALGVVSETARRATRTLDTLGRRDHGETLIRAMIAHEAAKGFTPRGESQVEIVKGGTVRDGTKTVTVSTDHVEYETEMGRFRHVDYPDQARYIKNMITGAAQMDGAILVVSAAEGPVPQMRDQLLLAHNSDVPIVVFLDDIDLVDDNELVDLVEGETRKLLTSCGFGGDKVPILRGSSQRASESPDHPESRQDMQALIDMIDAYIPAPALEEEQPFQMAVEDVFSVEGRGTVVTGQIHRGVIKVGDEIEIVGLTNRPRKTTCTAIEMFRKQLDEGHAGDNVGCLLHEIASDEVERGQVLAAPGSVNSHARFEAKVYALSEQEGGRDKPFFSGYQPTFDFHTSDVAGTATLVEAEMCIPGDQVMLTTELAKPLAMEVGSRFTIRDGGRTVGSGIVTKLIK